MADGDLQNPRDTSVAEAQAVIKAIESFDPRETVADIVQLDEQFDLESYQEILNDINDVVTAEEFNPAALNEALDDMFDALNASAPAQTIYEPGATMPQELLLKIVELVAMGHGISASTQSRESRTAELRNARHIDHFMLQAQIQAVNSRLDDISARLGEIEKRIGDIEREMAENQDHIDRLVTRNAQIDTVLIPELQAEKALIDALIADINNNEERLTSIMSNRPGLTGAVGAYRESANGIVTIAHGTDARRHLVHQDENGEYFIRIDGENITIADESRLAVIAHQINNGELLGNNPELTDDAVERFIAAQNNFYEMAGDDAPELAELFAQKEALEIRAASLGHDFSSLVERSTAIDAQIEALRGEHAANTVEIAELEALQRELGAELQALQAEAAELRQEQTQLTDSYEALLLRWQEEQANLEAVEQDQAAVMPILEGFGSRHEFLRNNISGLFGPFSFWGNTISDDEGNVVYHDENEGLYHLARNENDEIILGEDGHPQRVYYTDPAQVTDLMSRAWNDERPASFGNESRARGKNEDTANTFRDTFFSKQSTAQERADMQAAIEAQEEETEEARRAAQLRCEANSTDPHRLEGAPNCRAAFAGAAPLGNGPAPAAGPSPENSPSQ